MLQLPQSHFGNNRAVITCVIPILLLRDFRTLCDLDIYIYIYIIYSRYRYRYIIIILYIIYYIYYISGCGFKSHSGQFSVATSKSPSVVNTICISSFRYFCVITSRKTLIKINVVTDEGNSQNET